MNFFFASFNWAIATLLGLVTWGVCLLNSPHVRWLQELKAIAAAMLSLMARQDAPTLAFAGAFFIVLSNFTAPILGFLAWALPPLLMGWGLFHALLASLKIGSRLFSQFCK